MSSNLDHAMALARRGFRVFPLTHERTPAIKGWKDAATTDPTIIRTWFAGTTYGVAVATGRGLFAVDADVKHDAPGLQSLDLLAMLGADLAFTVATPSGGRHAYFTSPDDEPVPNSVKRLPEFPGIDIRGDGGYVAAPGTPGYTLLTDADPPIAPAWLLSAVRGRHRPREHTSTPVTDLDTEPALQRAIAYLLHDAPEAIEGAGGNDATYRVLARVKDFGVSRERAVLLLEQHWNEAKASPPWAPDELDQIADNVYAYGTSAPGIRSALAEFDPVEIDQPAIAFARPATYGDASPPPREFIVAPLIPAHKATLLTGDGGVGKTLLAQQILTAVATNQDFFGLPTRHGPVLAVFSEDDEAELWRRQIDINRSVDLAMGDLGHVNWWSADHVSDSGCVLMSFTRDNPEGKLAPFFKRLDAALAQVRPVLFALDPIANMFGGSEIDRAQVTGFVNRVVNRLCVKHQTTALMLAHPSVAGMAEGTGRSGSTGWANAVRSRLYLTRPRNDVSGNYRVLKTTKANYGRWGDEWKLKWSQGCFTLATGGTDDPELAAEQALLAALRVLILERGEPLSSNSRAGNYAIGRAMRLPECDGRERGALEEAFESLQRRGLVWLEEQDDGRRRVRQVVCVAPDAALPDPEETFG